ncbi:MAG: hypothetical protein HY097_06465 [Nitrospinae bacterium]|nr:hypothetical protein [Nitrospinota bacterium]MBI3814081.1 hypothetical protein [Nitrospinota bacterium]
MDTEKEKPKKTFREKLCPFVQNPHDDCYCVGTNSSKVMPMIYYCGENFKECKIYENLSEKFNNK